MLRQSQDRLGTKPDYTTRSGASDTFCLDERRVMTAQHVRISGQDGFVSMPSMSDQKALIAFLDWKGTAYARVATLRVSVSQGHCNHKHIVNTSQLQAQGAWTFQSLPPWPRCSCHSTRGPWTISSARTFRRVMHVWQHQFEQGLESDFAWLRWMEMATLRWKNSNRRRGNSASGMNMHRISSLGDTWSHGVVFVAAHHVRGDQVLPYIGEHFESITNAKEEDPPVSVLPEPLRGRSPRLRRSNFDSRVRKLQAGLICFEGEEESCQASL